ncbi:uncharacterized protein LOC117808791 [Notolabrus celidotus]|uniref:uncharacterized protein LOC117808791 n=1 Tax=Notolabrus celidotus TaxID=1203425 RepID=UPI00148FDEB9|nr:uncharacterized protein LOC117808791 [Notolabrus celidotus]
MAMNSSSILEYISSVLIQSRSPAIYKVMTKKERIGNLTRITLGKKDVSKLNKTILLVGETGTGKSTLINALVNYAMGVKWEDNVWFQIVEDNKTGQAENQCESQTSDVNVYEIFGFEGKTLPYSLTIIDTPGYGDTGGIDHDDIVSQRLLELFGTEGGVHEINAVGLVLKSTVNRLDDRQCYIFNAVLSLFGKNMEDSIVALLTHSNGRQPKNALTALEAAKMKCAKDAKGQPVYFLFENCQTEDRGEDPDYLEHVNDITMKGMRQFAQFLHRSEPKGLKMTVDVLKERMRLMACIRNLKERVEFIEKHLEEIQRFDGSMPSLLLFMRMFSGVHMVEPMIEKRKWLEESFQSVVKLEQIALNADSLYTHEHLDFLIKTMEETRDAEKIQKLKEMKSRVDGVIKAGLRYKAAC